MPNIQITAPLKQNDLKRKQKIVSKQSPTKRNGDIRAMFSTVKSTKNYTKVLNDLGLQNEGNIPNTLLDLLIELNVEVNDDSKCTKCDEILDYKLSDKTNLEISHKPLIYLINPVYPDINLFNEIDSKSINTFIRNNKRNITICNKSDISMNVTNQNRLSTSETLNVDNILHDKCENFDIGNIEDIFDNSEPKVMLQEENKPKDTLEYFGLDSIDDIFAEWEEEQINTSQTSNENISLTQKTKTNSNSLVVVESSDSETDGQDSIDRAISSPIKRVLDEKESPLSDSTICIQESNSENNSNDSDSTVDFNIRTEINKIDRILKSSNTVSRVLKETTNSNEIVESVFFNNMSKLTKSQKRDKFKDKRRAKVSKEYICLTLIHIQEHRPALPPGCESINE